MAHPKLPAVAQAVQKARTTKSKTQPVAETDSEPSSSDSESDASSQLTDLWDSDDKVNNDKEFAPGLTDDALGDLLAKEVSDTQ